MSSAYLNRKISPRVVNGHPWIFNNEVAKVDGEVQAGDIVDVYTYDKKFIGKMLKVYITKSFTHSLRGYIKK